MTRNGKIARLSASIRDELNLRLENGEEGATLLAWLNGLPQVQASLKANFGGAPVSKQNLFEWRQGGFRGWQMCQEWLDQMESETMAAMLGGGERGKRIADLIAATKHDLPPAKGRKKEDGRRKKESGVEAVRCSRVKPSQTESSPVAPSQAAASTVEPSQTAASPVKPSPTQSNQDPPSPAHAMTEASRELAEVLAS